jgi:hypothetical protein
MKRLCIILVIISTVWAQDKIKIHGYFDEVISNNVLTLTIKSENTQFVYNDDKHAILIINSDGGELSLKVFWGDMYLGHGPRSVTYRIGGGDWYKGMAEASHPNNSITELWQSTNDYTVTISKNPLDILKGISDSTSTKIIFRTTPFQENPITFEFDVSELNLIVEKYPNHFASIKTPSVTEIIGEMITRIIIGVIFIVILYGEIIV